MKKAVPARYRASPPFARRFPRPSAPVILSVWRRPSSPEDPAPSFGCGSRRFSGWRPNMPKDCLPFVTEPSTKTDTPSADRFIISKKGWGKNGNGSRSSLPFSACASGYSASGPLLRPTELFHRLIPFLIRITLPLSTCSAMKCPGL